MSKGERNRRLRNPARERKRELRAVGDKLVAIETQAKEAGAAGNKPKVHRLRREADELRRKFDETWPSRFHNWEAPGQP